LLLKSRLAAILVAANLFASSNPDESVNWKALVGQSSLFLGIQHGFRLSTEPGTRNGLKGPFWNGYYNALSNLHGWADGDPFYVNYIGHPMQGAVSAYIWNQNDGKYRRAEFGRNSAYWKSRLRATAFSWAYSTQFEIGPISEASIGKIQNLHPQQGFVDHVATPLIGLAWQIGEDAIDRYIIRKFEARSDNKWAGRLLRGGLNPSRSFANLLRWQPPWHRDSRPSDLDGARYTTPTPVSVNAEGPPRSLPAFEFNTASMYMISPGPRESRHCVGGLGTAQWNNTATRSWLIEVGGCKMIDQKENLSGDILSYMIGQRWTDRNGRWMPFGQVLAGGRRVTIDEVSPEKKAAVEAANPGRKLGYEFHPLWTQTNQANGFAVSVGGGLDFGITRAATWRIASVDFNRSWLYKPELASYPNSIRFSTGITINIGNW
jgi:hypothetical protein